MSTLLATQCRIKPTARMFRTIFQHRPTLMRCFVQCDQQKLHPPDLTPRGKYSHLIGCLHVMQSETLFACERRHEPHLRLQGRTFVDFAQASSSSQQQPPAQQQCRIRIPIAHSRRSARLVQRRSHFEDGLSASD